MSQDVQALIVRFGNAKPAGNGSKIQPGNHYLAIISYGFKPTDDHGQILAVELEVLQSDTMQPGVKVDEAFFVSKSDQNGGTYEVARAMNFTNALTGNPPNDAPAFARESAKLIDPSQPGRGLVIQCKSWEEKKTYGKRSPKRGQEKLVIERQWEHVPGQTPEQTRAIRGNLDAKYPIVAPAPAAAQPQQQWGGPPQGYASAPAPQGPPPGYQQPPQGYGPPPTPPSPQPTWGAPAPQPAPAAAPATPPSWGGWQPPR